MGKSRRSLMEFDLFFTVRISELTQASLRWPQRIRQARFPVHQLRSLKPACRQTGYSGGVRWEFIIH
ncbi:MAG: hypothetical protein ACJ75F_09380, partial [Flavisolibacter sp.]